MMKTEKLSHIYTLYATRETAVGKQTDLQREKLLK